jgi:diketogulonate reductase-like aldo/keto reductase
MYLKQLGRTGVLIPELGLGTWDYHAGPGPLRRGLEQGALFIDTAESYGTERVVREAIAGMRDHVFVATKISPQNFHAQNVRGSVEGSLKELGVERIDLLQLHEPNPDIPIAETMGGLKRLVEEGKVRYAGVSNFSVAQLQAAQAAFAPYPVVSNQVRYSLIDRTIERDLLPYCRRHGLTVIAYCPLARGLDRIRDCDPQGVVDRLARTTGRSSAQVVLNWCLCQEGVIAIPKGNSEEHVVDNCGASGWRLSAEQLHELDTRIQYRRRTSFDTLVRRCMPSPLHRFAVATVKRLPRGMRRRIR